VDVPGTSDVTDARNEGSLPQALAVLPDSPLLGDVSSAGVAR